MKKILPNLLFFYCTIASVFIIVSTIFTINTLLFLPITAYFVVEFFGIIKSEKSDVNPKRIEIITQVIIFTILLSVSITKIRSLPTNTKKETQEFKSNPLIINKVQNTPVPENKLNILITDDSKEINIRSKPSIYSDIARKTKNHEEFIYTEKKGEWYEVKLNNDTFGYVSFKYVDEKNLK